MKTILLSLFLLWSSIFLAFDAKATQTIGQNSYISAVDQDLAIKSIVLVPPTDNVGGIYSRPIEEKIRQLLNEDKQWSLSNFPKELEIKTEILDERPADVQKILKAANSEAAIATQIIKGPRGISITMTLFVGREGLPLLQQRLTDYKGFEITEIKSEVAKLFEDIKYRMPFRANILSRRGQQVTLNLGSSYGLKAESHVSIVQLIKINRHPKTRLLIGTEKEVLGRVKLFKVAPYLSFGFVVMEKDPGLIAVGAKVMPDEFVKYSVPVLTPSGKILQDVTTRPDKDLAFGDDPTEWVPTAPPQFGNVQLLAGLSSYTQNANLVSSGSVTGGSPMAPNIMVRGETWLNPNWYLGLNLRQSIFSIPNNLTGSSPGNLNMALSQYGVNLGYNFLLTENFFGPKFQFSTGMVNTNFTIDDSNPTAFTTMKYGGIVLSLAGQVPLSEELPMDIGGRFDFFMTSSLSENKKSGASSTNQINTFSFFADYKLRPKFKVRGEILLENYKSSFSGTGPHESTSISHKLTTLLGGIEYLF